MSRTFERRDHCCLCGKSKEQVEKLIVGLHGAVCSSCIDLCDDILSSEGLRPPTPAPQAKVRKPSLFGVSHYFNGIRPEDTSAEFKAQLASVIEQLELRLAEMRATSDHVLKLSVFVTSLTDYDQAAPAFDRVFGDHKRIRSVVEVARLPDGAAVQLDVVVTWP